uniref:Uncharacterized protein n=1 Tax=Aplanochytrium stocchinoi TaxID=215587 RepID=A0A7S3LPZ7_9STRA
MKTIGKIVPPTNPECIETALENDFIRAATNMISYPNSPRITPEIMGCVCWLPYPSVKGDRMAIKPTMSPPTIAFACKKVKNRKLLCTKNSKLYIYCNQPDARSPN